MKTKQELRDRVYTTREACKWDPSVDNIIDYQESVAEYNAAVPIREHLEYDAIPSKGPHTITAIEGGENERQEIRDTNSQ